VDLLDPADCRTKLGPLTNISQLFYLLLRSVRILARRCRRTPTCSSTSSRPSMPPHPRSSMSISRKAPGGTETTSVPTRLRPRG
jgi:hypothetical protein